MTTIYIRKIEKALSRQLAPSEKKQAVEFCAAGYSVNYAVEYFK